MIDIDAYEDRHVLSTDEAREWLFPTLGVASGRRKVVSLGCEPLPVRGRQYSWLAGDLRRAVLGQPPMPREPVERPSTRMLQMVGR